jgi:hypothetical protein
MDTRWYPAALSLSIVACGGDVDGGNPSATGGAPQFFYGPSVYVGGATGVDTGKPLATGGRTPAPLYGIMPQYTGGAGAGGSKAGMGGNVTTVPMTSGGTTIDAGTPSTGGYRPLPMYMANMRLPPSDCGDGSRKYFARAFKPRKNSAGG